MKTALRYFILINLVIIGCFVAYDLATYESPWDKPTYGDAVVDTATNLSIDSTLSRDAVRASNTKEIVELMNEYYDKAGKLPFEDFLTEIKKLNGAYANVGSLKVFIVSADQQNHIEGWTQILTGGDNSIHTILIHQSELERELERVLGRNIDLPVDPIAKRTSAPGEVKLSYYLYEPPYFRAQFEDHYSFTYQHPVIKGEPELAVSLKSNLSNGGITTYSQLFEDPSFDALIEIGAAQSDVISSIRNTAIKSGYGKLTTNNELFYTPPSIINEDDSAIDTRVDEALAFKKAIFNDLIEKGDELDRIADEYEAHVADESKCGINPVCLYREFVISPIKSVFFLIMLAVFGTSL